MFTLEDLGSKSTQSNGSSKDCITDITGGWVCDAGNPHTPADCNSESNPNGKCNACGSEYVVKIEYGHCPDTEFDLNGSTGGVTVDLGEESDPNTPGGDEGGTNNSDVTETLPITPCKNADETDINGNCFDEIDLDFEITETLEFQNETCLKSIKDAIVSTGKMQKIIKKFEPTNPVLHLEWGIFYNTDWGNTGNTSLNSEQNTAFININKESLSHVSNIVIVKTIAHEIIHAELYRKLKELVDDYRIISLEEYIALQDNYLGIADYTFRYGELEYSQNIAGQLVTWGLTPNFSEAHHNQMADFYRGTLIEVMKAYDSSNNITRVNADEFYEALSWAGLRGFSDENDNI